jgi:hypothetical protein
MASSTSLFNRMVRAAQLQPAFYEEVEADTTATAQALLSVVIVSVATGIGAGFDQLTAGGGGDFVYGLMFGLAAAVIGWLLWALFAYIFGVSILKGPQTSSTWGELLRTMGFANSPGVFRIFAFLPGVGGIIAFAASIWTLIAAIIAVRQALDFSTWRAILTALIGWLAYMFLVFALFGLIGGGMPLML